MADAAEPSVFWIATMSGKKIINFVETGGLAEVGGEILKSVLKRR